MWVEMFKQQGLFTPHSDICDASEVFIPMYSGSSVGFCIEINERSADLFTSARATCASVGKRLPEPSEWLVACQTPSSGLNNMTNGAEWSTNFSKYIKNATYGGYFAMFLGNGGCITSQLGVVATESWTGHSQQSFAFRCVR